LRRISTLAVAISAVLAMTAILASASASASTTTALCKTWEWPCPAGQVAPAGSWYSVGVAPNAGTFSMKSSGILHQTFHCDYALLAAKTTAKTGAPLSAEGHGLINQEHCAVNETPAGQCSSVTVNTPPTTLEALAGKTAEMVMGNSTQPFTISYTCYWKPLGYVQECTYSAPNGLPIKINSEGHPSIEGVTLNLVASNGRICGSQTTLTMESEVSAAEEGAITTA
jgi:opacity protein-like surface antigen